MDFLARLASRALGNAPAAEVRPIARFGLRGDLVPGAPDNRNVNSFRRGPETAVAARDQHGAVSEVEAPAGLAPSYAARLADPSRVVVPRGGVSLANKGANPEPPAGSPAAAPPAQTRSAGSHTTSISSGDGGPLPAFDPSAHFRTALQPHSAPQADDPLAAEPARTSSASSPWKLLTPEIALDGRELDPSEAPRSIRSSGPASFPEGAGSLAGSVAPDSELPGERRADRVVASVSHAPRAEIRAAESNSTFDVIPTPEAAPVIRVTIGRVEVRAVTPQMPQPPTSSARPDPRLSLSDYLGRRGESG